MAKELNIDVKADNNFLYCNGQAIGIGCNSTYATLMEFTGYVFVRYFMKRSSSRPEKYLRDVVKRYWYTAEQMEKFRQAVGE